MEKVRLSLHLADANVFSLPSNSVLESQPNWFDGLFLWQHEIEAWKTQYHYFWSYLENVGQE